MRRHGDWLWQAEGDVEAARHVREGGYLEWACFMAQQAAEKAAKAAHQAEGTEAIGHSVVGLLGGFRDVPAGVVEAAMELDRHYIPPRYPNAHPEGAPRDRYTERDADRALAEAEEVLAYVRRRLSQA